MQEHFFSEAGLGLYRISGRRDMADSQRVWQVMEERIAAEPLRGVLLFDATHSVLRLTEIQTFVEWMVTQNFQTTVKVAVVTSVPGDPNDSYFGANCAQFRGWHNIRAFQTEQAARAWLAESTGPAPLAPLVRPGADRAT